MIALCVWLIPLVWSLREPENQAAFENFVGSLGFFGILLMLGIQVLQIVVAVIPGEPIELIMGLMYGTWGGLALTLTGILIGSAIIYFCMKRFGTGFASKFVDTNGFKKFRFLNDPAKRDSFIFLLFFIPGTPKDVSDLLRAADRDTVRQIHHYRDARADTLGRHVDACRLVGVEWRIPEIADSLRDNRSSRNRGNPDKQQIHRCTRKEARRKSGGKPERKG